MRITFTARHFNAPPNVKEFAERKVKKIKKYYDGIIDCDILLTKEKLDHIADVSANVYGQQLRVVEKTEDIFKSIDNAVDKLERQVKRYKEKMKDHSPGKALNPDILE